MAKITLVSDREGALPLGHLPAYHAARDPRRPMITLGDETLTREQFEPRANRRARMLAAQGVGLGDFVTIALPNSFEFYETSFACWKLGAIPNVIPAKMPDAEIGAIIEIVEPKLVVGLDPSRVPGRATLPPGLAIDESLSPDPLPEAISPHWKAMVSGGSTGRPKVILDGMDGRWDPNVATLGQAPEDTLLNPGPLYHNAPFIGMHCGLFAGAHVVDMVRFDAERALDLIDRFGVTWVNMVPTMMNRIWRLPADVRARYSLKSLRVLMHMAAPCPAWLKEAWIDWLGPDRVLELYAGTERQGATLITGREWLERRGSVGRVQPGARLVILDEDGGEVPTGQVGEIYFLPDAGQGSTYRYLGAEPKTRGAWESLGDLGWLDADGYLYLADRRTDLILSGGANIYPAEVEAALEAHPAVKGAVVIGLPDDDLGQRVHAIVQAEDVTADALLAFVGERLSRYKVPRSVEFTDEPLRDDAGKVRRSQLKAERA